jgi:2,4-dienoyl-CoA reductase-like NADH-dependent reductase (Old Yellow Enzyme family)
MQYGFPYRALDALYADRLTYPLPLPGDVSLLAKPVRGNGFTLSNALVIHPMEGCDADIDGAPAEWTFRRYRRFAGGGAGLIWMEAVAVSHESRGNPHQLYITRKNMRAFKALRDEIDRAADASCLPPPVVIVQLTHSGRFSNPEPIPANRNPVLDAHQRLPENWPLIGDRALSELPAAFAESAELCMEAGFDGIDIKACHLYLLNELLGANERLGVYGGSLQNRMRLILASAGACRTAIGSGILAARVNLYDGEAARWGAGEGGKLDLSEPLQLVKALAAHGVSLLNITMGTPYFNPHVNRPYASGGYDPPESPLEGVGRLLHGCACAKEAAPGALCVATGFSYLRQFAPTVAAGLLAAGGADAAGFGRTAFAYPDFARDIINTGAMTPRKCCVTCGLCSKIMRAGGRAGCPVRDAGQYVQEFERVSDK